MSTHYDAVVAGHICLDMLPDLSGSTPEQFRKTFAPGRLLQTGPMSFSTGGPVSNTGLALHKLGVATALMGKIGDDLFGQAIRDIVGAQGPELAGGMIVDPSVASSYTVVISAPGLDRMFLHCPGANDTFRAADIRYELLREARLFHFGYPPLIRAMFEPDGEQLIETFRRAKETGITTSLDMALPDPASAAGRANWTAILGATLPYVDVFLPSIEEILFTLRRPLYKELMTAAVDGDILPLVTPQLLRDVSDELLRLGAKIVGLKLGARGLYLHTGSRAAIDGLGRAQPSDPGPWVEREFWSPCFKVDVVGTLGSGDTTIAGFLSALLHDMAPAQAVTAAVAVGACNVEAADTLSGLQTWDNTMRRVAAGWAKHEMHLNAPGWQYDAHEAIWTASRS